MDRFNLGTQYPNTARLSMACDVFATHRMRALWTGYHCELALVLVCAHLGIPPLKITALKGAFAHRLAMLLVFDQSIRIQKGSNKGATAFVKAALDLQARQHRLGHSAGLQLVDAFPAEVVATGGTVVVFVGPGLQTETAKQVTTGGLQRVRWDLVAHATLQLTQRLLGQAHQQLLLHRDHSLLWWCGIGGDRGTGGAGAGGAGGVGGSGAVPSTRGVVGPSKKPCTSHRCSWKGTAGPVFFPVPSPLWMCL